MATLAAVELCENCGLRCGWSCMKCPHCGKRITKKQAAQALRKIPSESRAEASRLNGAKGGRPKKSVEPSTTLGSEQKGEL